MKTFVPSELTARQRHQFILGSVGPRPVAFVSTLDENGKPNLAPFSFFNVFCSSPPILIFSNSNRHKDGAEKDTLRNIRQTGEVVINLVDYNMVRQMAIAGIEYPHGISEFEKSGLTPIASDIVKPFRVKESPAHYECKVLEIKPLGDKPGGVNLVIAQGLLIHIRESAIGPDERINPHMMDLVGRLGGFNYCRASGDAVFPVVQPHSEIAIGFDALPDNIKNSRILTGNELAQLAGVTSLPSGQLLDDYIKGETFIEFLNNLPGDPQLRALKIHGVIREYLLNGEVENAWLIILATNT